MQRAFGAKILWYFRIGSWKIFLLDQQLLISERSRSEDPSSGWCFQPPAEYCASTRVPFRLVQTVQTLHEMRHLYWRYDRQERCLGGKFAVVAAMTKSLVCQDHPYLCRIPVLISLAALVSKSRGGKWVKLG